MLVEIDRVNWFSTYHVHHRVANQFRNGRAFLLGDAAHIHSPVGGQGMNTGIGDAVNLAWKLAAVLRGANPLLLGTYQPERMAFANRLVETTDRAFVVATKNGGIARRMRLHVVPRVLPPLVKLQRVRRFMFRTVSQTGIHYHASPLSLGSVGGVRAGDRLPWIPKATKDGRDNHSALSSLDWQVHVFSGANPMLRLACEERRIPIHTFEWSPAAKAAGMKRDAYYLVRPDGHVAIALPVHVPAPLATFLREWNIRGT
jgi:hypothetical protein